MITRIAKTSLLLATLIAPAAHAGVVFSDDFNGDTQGLNATPLGWSVTNGTVDVIGTGYYDFIPGNGNYLDLDGSTGQAGLLSKDLSSVLTNGTTYRAEFQLGGEHRNPGSEVVTVTFGDQSSILNIPNTQGFVTYSLDFTANSTAPYTLSFWDNSYDNQGALLDNVTVSSVPVPGAVWLFGTALLGMLGIKRKAA